MYIPLITIIAIFIQLYCVSLQPVHASENKTFLALDTGGHTSSIRALAVTSDKKYLVSAGYDKVIRVWDLQAKKEIRKILGSIGEGGLGKISGLAFSPDDKYLIVSGYFEDNGIRIFDFLSGQLTKTLKSHSAGSEGISFSSDGKYLVSGSFDKTVKIWDATNNFQLIHTFSDHDKAIGQVAIFKHGDDYRVVSAGDDKVNLFSLKEKKLLSSFRYKNTKSFVAVSNKYIALTGYDHTSIHIMDLDLNPVKTITRDTPHVIAFSPDSNLLLTGKGDRDSNKPVIYRVSKEFNEVAAFDKHRGGNVYAVTFLDHSTAITAGGGDQSIYGWDVKTGETRWHLGGSGISKGKSVGLKNNIIGVGGEKDEVQNNATNLFQKELIYFDITKPAVQNGKIKFPIIPKEWGNFKLMLGKSEGSGFLDSALDIFDGTGQKSGSIRPHPTYRHYAYGFSNKGEIISAGSRGRLTAYDTKGKYIATFQGHTYHVYDIAIDGDRLVSVSDDQTIKLWNLKELDSVTSTNSTKVKTILPLVSLFIGKDNKWVMWTPEGFFDHSPGGEELIGWHLNQGNDKEALFFPASKLYKEFYRPDLVQASLEGKDLSVYAKDIDINKILSRETIPPTVHFLTKSGSADSYDTSIRAQVCDTGGGIGDVTLFLNDMPVAVETAGRGLKVVEKNRDGQCYSFERTITLSPGANSIQLMAYNKANTIESHRDTIEINHTATAAQPELHLLTVAVNAYRDGDLRLKYALPDADALEEQAQAKGKGLFGKVHIHTLRDGDVTKDGLTQAFSRIGAKMKREDVFLLFVAGHGITDEKEGTYYFLPADFRYTGEGEVQKQGVSMTDFRNMLANVQAMKSLILLDTCNSGSFAEAITSRGLTEKTAITKLSRAVGRATIVASSRNQAALEGYNGHGAFTWTILEGMKGRAADQGGKITINTLATFIEEELPKLTYNKWGYEQVPQKTLQGMDFQIGVK